LRFPHSVLPWAAALDAVVDPADIWVARLVGGLPAAVRQAKRLGGAAIYDSGDVYVQSRELAGGGIYAGIVAWWERRLARSCAAVTTVNDPYARLLERQLRVPRPQVVMNCPPRYDPPEPRPELLRAALGLPAETRVALYQGALLTGRGLEQAMSAVVEVPETVLAILGFGGARDAIDRRARQKPYSGRVHLLPPVAPAELLDWVASADVVLLPLQDSSPNHRYSTPNKLFEALAVGTPVVASDLPGLASVVRDTGCGELVDGADPTAIAAGIRRIVDAPREEREALRARCLRAAHERYDWEGQEGVLLEVFRKVLSR
jgi:glycosyltransferase involved in cell wall biosynthesis